MDIWLRNVNMQNIKYYFIIDIISNDYVLDLSLIILNFNVYNYKI